MNRLTDPDSAYAYGESLLMGELVRLRGLRDDDLSTLVAWEMDAGRMATRSGTVAPPSESEAADRLRTWCGNEKGDVGLVIETREDSTLVGEIGLVIGRSKNRSATVALSLGREHTGRGYGTDAITVMVGYGFRELGLHRIGLEVWSFNTGAIRSYEKAGFIEEGRRRDAIFHDGEWYDGILMSILEPDWRGNQTER